LKYLNALQHCVQEYVKRLDANTNLGLTSESIASYSIGQITRSKRKFVRHSFVSVAIRFTFSLILYLLIPFAFMSDLRLLFVSFL